jgi:hypothetical protein
VNICDSQKAEHPPEHCTLEPSVVWICRIEGREVRHCQPCDAVWKKQANRIPALKQRCPNCAYQYFDSRIPPERDFHTGTSDGEPLEGPLANAIDRAMLAEGVLADTRKRVLARLASDDDSYISMLLRSASGAAA